MVRAVPSNNPPSDTSPAGYHAFIVQPRQGFDPADWRQRPDQYRVISYEGCKRYRGQADAWLFLQNKSALEQGLTDRWAIYIK